MKSVWIPAAAAFSLLFLSACAQSPEKLLATANKYHANKKYDEAAILYQKVLIKDKTNAEAYYRLGLNYIDQGKIGEAAQSLRRAVDLQPTNVDAETKLADIYLGAYATASDKKKNRGLLDDARDLDDKILKQNPNSFAGLRIKGALALTHNDLPGALAFFEKANQIKPDSPELAGMYALSLFQAGKRDQGIELLSGTLARNKAWNQGYDLLYTAYIQTGQKDKAEEVLRQHLEADPKSPLAIAYYANFKLASGDFAGGEQIIKRTLNDPKTFPMAHLMVGKFYERAGKADLAMEQFQAGAKDDPKNTVNYQERIIELKAATNHPAEALSMAKDVSDKNPKDAAAGRMYAELLLRTGQPGSAPKTLETIKELSANNPGDSALHLDLARAYALNSQPDKALTEADLAITNERKSAHPNGMIVMQAQTLSARIYSDKGDSDSEHKALEKAQLILDANPNDGDAILIKDRALIATGDAEKAKPDLEAIAAKMPNVEEVHVELANVYLEEHQWDKASQEFEAAAKLAPQDARAVVGAQRVKLFSGHVTDAIQGMREFASKNPNFPGARVELANFQAAAASMPGNQAQAKELLQEASDNYKEVLKTNSGASDVWMRLGLVQRMLGQEDQALASFEQAGNANRNNSAAFLQEGQILESMNRKKEAMDAYNKVITLDPNNPLALNNLAYMNADAGSNLDQAQSYAEHAKKQAPNSPDVADTLGYVYLKKKLNAQAAEIFRQNVADHPDNPNFRFHLAMALLQEGDKQGAKQQATKALESANSNPELQKQIKELIGQIG